MEFRTATFKKDEEEPSSDNRWLIYTLLTLIFLLLTYLLQEFGVTGWPLGILFVATFVFMYLIRYHKWGEKEVMSGFLDKELVISSSQIQIDDLTIEISSIDKLTFELDKYNNQTIINYDVINKSDGTANRIIVTTNGISYSEYFRIGTEMHLAELNKVIKQLRENETAVEVINKS